MDYDRRRTRWPYVFLYLIYVAGVVYLLMSSNKYLYSHRELRVALAGERLESVAPVPRLRGEIPDLGEPTYWSRATPERTSHLADATRDKAYVAEWSKVILEEGQADEIQSWAADDSGVYVTGAGSWAYAYDVEGAQKWRFRFAKKAVEKGLLEPILDQKQIYLTQPSGQIIALNKVTGRLSWKLLLAEEILTAPLLMGDELWLVVKPLESERQRLDDKNEATKTKISRKPKAPNPAQHRFARLNRKTGELISYSDLFTTKSPAYLTWNRTGKQILLASDNKLTAFNSETGAVLSSQTLPDAIQGPAVAAEGSVYVALTSGKIQSWNMGKEGKFEWELEVEGSPQSSPTFIPLYNRLTVMTDNGYLHMIDLKKAEYLWKFSLENHNPNQEIYAARLTGRHIENLSMKWEKKGWTAWAACSDNRICVYNPDKGQLLSRIPANGAVLSAPLFVGKNFFLITTEKNGDGHRFRLTHFMDEDDFKQKTKEAEAAAAAKKDKADDSSI